MRLAKYLAHAGVASRRAAETLIADGRVRVGREVVTDPARDVDGSVPVSVDNRPVAPPADRVVYAVNKRGAWSRRPRTPMGARRSSPSCRATAGSTRSAGWTPRRPA